MIYENYTVKRAAHDWVLTKVVATLRPFDNAHGKKGDEITRTVIVGYYGGIETAIGGIIRDKAGVGCADLNALKQQLEAMRSGLAESVSKLKPNQ